MLENATASLNGPSWPVHLAPRSPHDAYQLTWAAGGQGGRRYGTRTPDAGPKRGSNETPFRRVTPGSRGLLRGSPWSVRGHLGLSELIISTQSDVSNSPVDGEADDGLKLTIMCNGLSHKDPLL